jgi:1,4-alpha-glucan branching enzyme
MQKTYLENPGSFILRSEVKPADKQNHAEKIAISFSVRAPGARSVAVAGSFSNWDLKIMLSSCGDWQTTILLPPGRYEYRFIVDGQWLLDPAAKETSKNQLGSLNSILRVV